MQGYPEPTEHRKETDMNDATPWFEQINQTQTKAINAVMSFNELTSKSVEKLAQYEIGLANEALNEGAETIQTLGKVNSLPEILDRQKGLFEELGHRVLDTTKARVDLLVELQGEYVKWFEAQIAELAPAAEGVAAKPAPRRTRARKSAPVAEEAPAASETPAPGSAG